MTDSWDDYAENWDADKDARSYADYAFASLREHLDVQNSEWKQRRVLDFGCGTGLLTEKLAPLVEQVVAVDTSQKMIDRLSKKRIRNVTPICANFDNRHDQERANKLTGFELIVASSVCSFLPDYESMLTSLAKTLKPDGYFVQWDWLKSTDEDLGLTIDRVTNAIRNAGLKCVHVGKAFALLTDKKEAHVLIGVGARALP